MKKIVFPMIAVVLTLVLIIVAAEAAFRVRDIFDKNRGLRNSTGDLNRKYWHVFKPNTNFRLVSSKEGEYDVAVRINNYGFRGKDIAMDRKNGVMRIMVMGDSFTFGVGAEEYETIPYLIEKYVIERGGGQSGDYERRFWELFAGITLFAAFG